MFSLDIKEILKATKGKLIRKGAKQIIRAISTDTRKIKEGGLFIALKGDNFNGHDFIGEAVKRGAAGAIIKLSAISHQLSTENKLFLIQVKDTLKAYGDIAHYYRMKFNIPFIGITGSSGKTTAKEMMYKVLSSRFAVLKNEGTENNFVGLPATLLKLEKAHSVGVLELGTNHFGEIKRLAAILNPTVGVITTIGPAHLEFFESERGVFKEKIELLNSLGKEGTAIINADDLLLAKLKGLKCKIIRFGVDNKCDFRAGNISQDNETARFRVNERYNFKIKLLGRHNIYNALTAIAAGFLFKISPDEIYKNLWEFQPIGKRLCIKQFGQITVIDDTYNANPQSVSAALRVLSDYETGGKKIFVCADMLELGKEAYRFHAESGMHASRSGLNYLISIGNFSRAVREGAISGGMNKDVIFTCKDNTTAAKILKGILKEKDVVLVKGSRRMKLEEVVDALSSFIPVKGDMVRV